ncbi:MAG: hypothetical protein GWO20_00175 [Candidatus Korarchaeota archaeon]|nr:hypothetical protein [Candidatus Korarchaeota archaeon]NIU81963.1 hypothetical protein [Candidatus Thorarchaeota archaeon]NIW12413.1 hypothetical protein [Candidatus Thorarchaeota archaeon]NIW50634.1 hypothetical protein [Candidatus Korarchaeota archaeon]
MQKIEKGTIAQSLAILTTVLETIAGVCLFLVWSIYTEVQFVYEAFLIPLLWTELVTLLITFVVSSTILFSPLSGFISITWKIFLSGFLSFIVLTLTIIISLLPFQIPKSSSLSLVPLFGALVLIIYITNYTREEAILRMDTHKRILNNLRKRVEGLESTRDLKSLFEEAFTSWDEIVKRETFQKWGLAESIFLSLLITLAFWGNLLLIKEFNLPFPFSQGIAVLGLLIFLLVMFLVDIVKGSKWQRVALYG